jgi:hypothetical protein
VESLVWRAQCETQKKFWDSLPTLPTSSTI